MKKTIFRIITLFLFILPAKLFSAPVYTTENLTEKYDQTETDDSIIKSISQINWITRNFSSDISLDTQKAKLQMPSGKKKASASILSKMPQLIQPPLLSLYVDNSQYLANSVILQDITSDQIYDFIMAGYKTPDVFSKDIKELKTTNILEVNKISSLLIKHKIPFNPETPIETVPSRPYSGIIIDARGSNPVHGEYVKEETKACFYPVIWDENMNRIYEKNMTKPEAVNESGLVQYHYTDDINQYKDRIGLDPLYIKATQVYGRNRTDPIISRKDALKILTVPENVKLLNEGKVVILLDKHNLIYNVSTPDKDQAYYVKYQTIKHFIISNMLPDIEVSEGPDGIVFSMQLNFYPDSPELLPSENERISMIAQQIKDLLLDDGYTILVEGHTADVGKPVGQLNLSIERTRTVMNALIGEGIESSLFSYKGYGGTMPIDTNLTEEGRAKNRRVDIIARPRQTYIQRAW